MRVPIFLPEEMTPENMQAARSHNPIIQIFHPDDADVFRAMLDAAIDNANIDHPETFDRLHHERLDDISA